MKKIILIFITLFAFSFGKAQRVAFMLNGAFNVSVADQQAQNSLLGGGGSFRFHAGAKHVMGVVGLSYDINQQIIHPNIFTRGLQSLGTNVGIGGYTNLGNGNAVFEGSVSMIHRYSTLSSQSAIVYQNRVYQASDLKGQSVGLQGMLGLHVPFGRDAKWGMNLQLGAAGMLYRNVIYKYNVQQQTCCGTTTQTVRDSFNPDPLQLPKAIFFGELGFSFFFGRDTESSDDWGSSDW
jgi:hypothetical protein